MKYRNLSIWRNIDKSLLIMYLLLSVIGYFTMYSSTFKGLDIQSDFWSANYGKQLIWIIITLFSGFFILLLDGSFIKNTAYFTYGFVLSSFSVYLWKVTKTKLCVTGKKEKYSKSEKQFKNSLICFPTKSRVKFARNHCLQ